MGWARRVALAAVLVLAGCQGGVVDPERVTPAPVPTASGPVTVDAEGATDRHRRALANRSHTTRVSLTVTYENGTTARLTDEFAVRDDDRYRYVRRVRGPYPQAASNFTIWQTRSAEFRRTTAANGTTTVTVSDSAGFGDITLSGFLRRVLSGFDWTAERANGRTTLTGRQTGPLTVPLPTELRTGDDATLDAEIRDGVVRSLAVRGVADHPESGQSVVIRMRFTVQRVGETEPARPAWANDSNADG